MFLGKASTPVHPNTTTQQNCLCPHCFIHFQKGDVGPYGSYRLFQKMLGLVAEGPGPHGMVRPALHRGSS